MAFVTGLPVGSRPLSLATRSSLTGAAVTSARPAQTSGPRMGYGDYSYSTDKTKGHVQQYYVDKFRVASDFTKGTPASEADAKLGRTAKGGVYVPIEGIPQVFDDALPARVVDVVPDPRLAEAAGSVYPWDLYYEDPAFAASTYADVADDEVSDEAFAKFRGAQVESRTAALSANDFIAQARVERLKAGFNERYLLTLDGALDRNQAIVEKISSPLGFTPTGQPQTEIPGYPYLASVGAMDFVKKPGESVAFWEGEKAPAGPALPRMGPPAEDDTPALP